jgi:hypothetical protein
LAELEAAAQDSWFEEEIEESKLCSCHMIIFSYHPWFIMNSQDDDIER